MPDCGAFVIFTLAESFFLIGVGWGFLGGLPDCGTLSEGWTAICVRGMVFIPPCMSSQHLYQKKKDLDINSMFAVGKR